MPCHMYVPSIIACKAFSANQNKKIKLATEKRSSNVDLGIGSGPAHQTPFHPTHKISQKKNKLDNGVQL